MTERKSKKETPRQLRERIVELERQNAELRASNAELTERTLELFSLFSLSTSLGTGVKLDQLPDGSMDFLGDLLGIEQFSLQLYEPKENRLYIKASLGIPREAREKCIITPPEGVAGHVFATGEARYIPDVTSEPRYLFYKGLNTQGGSLLSIPLVDDSLNPFGVLNISKPQPHAFSDNDLSLYSAVALQIAAIIQNVHSYQRLHELSLTDELTGVANRRAFFDELEDEHRRHVRYKKDYSLLLIDIDYFKRYNDRHGHLEGDMALKKLAQALDARLRQSDLLARYGGEEFAVLAVETDKEQAVQLAEALRKTVCETTFTLADGQPASELSITVGVANFPTDGKTHIQVLDRADKALYYGKSRGRNTVSSKVPLQHMSGMARGAKGDEPGRRGKGTADAGE